MLDEMYLLFTVYKLLQDVVWHLVPISFSSFIRFPFETINVFILTWQMKLQGVHVDEEQTVSDPELLAEVR